MASLVNDSLHESSVVALAYYLGDQCECKRCFKCVVEFIDAWTRQHFRYVSDGEIETIYTPALDIERIMNDGRFFGDCDDASVFIASLFKALGARTRFTAIKTHPHENYSHVFTEVLADNQWITVDITVPPGTILIDYGKMVQYV
jgi:Transglutaminase-like superfamily.